MTRPRDRGRTVHIPIETDEDPKGGEEMTEREPVPSIRKSGVEENTEPARESRGEESPEGVEKEISTTAKDLEEALDHLRRLQAEFENYRRRTQRERLEAGDVAQGHLVERLLPILDDLDRAARAADGEDSPVVQGLVMVLDNLRQVLADAGLEAIPAVGETFDPNRHEALMTEPATGEQVGKVLEELATGYAFKGRILRPARVKVGVEEN